jgi:HEPN domain-containing protein
MNRNDFKVIARIRLKEARVLLKNNCYDGAYYLSGYAVECSLKACIAKQTRRHDFPEKKAVQESYTHDLEGMRSRADVAR